MEKKLENTKTFRYEILESEHPEILLYVLHGYGQLAKFFVRKFEFLDNMTIVAPEGMHRFYLTGSDGRVGASWMTKEAREDDIHDNIRWLDALHREVAKNRSYKKVILLGFSQGGATAARWMELGETPFDGMILWACVYPPDLENRPSENSIPSYFAIGSDDEYYSGEKRKNIISFYEAHNFTIKEFIGKHDVHQQTLKDILLTLT